MASRIVALSGAAGSGKSEVAKHLIKSHGFELVKFAAPLKEMLHTFYMTQGLTKYEDITRRIEGDLKEVPDPLLGGHTPRYAMQTLGTEWGRSCLGSDFWTMAWLRRALAVPGGVVVDDCRFDNEAALVRANGGKVILLKPKTNRRKKSNHDSERGLSKDLVDCVVTNDGTIDDLNKRVAEFLYNY